MRLNVKQPGLDYERHPLMDRFPETLRSYLALANNKAQTETEPIGAEEAAKSLPALNQAARGKRRRADPR